MVAILYFVSKPEGGHKMEWSDDIINQLRALWAEGHSTAEIGRRLGVTKNAIVGKAHRLDLPARPSPIRRDPDAAPVRRATVRRVEGPTLPPLPSAVAEGDCGMPGFGQGAMTHGLVTPVNGTPGHMMPGHMMPGQGTPGHGSGPRVMAPRVMGRRVTRFRRSRCRAR